MTKASLLLTCWISLSWATIADAETVLIRERISAVAYDQKYYVFVGEKGRIFLSPDLKEWKARSTDTPIDFTGLAFGKGLFAATAVTRRLGTSPSVIVTSVDGVTWIERYRTSTDDRSLQNVCFLNNHFIAVGEKGNILISPDGLRWEQSFSGTDHRLWSVTYGQGKYVIGGGTIIAATILTSSDLKTWTPVTNKIPSAVMDLAFGQGLFVATPGYDSFFNESVLYTSEDAVQWTRQILNTSMGISSVAFGTNGFVSVGWQGTILRSSDGTTWETAKSGINEHLENVSFINGKYIAIWDQTTHGVVQSLDGLSWEPVRFNEDGRPRFLPATMYLIPGGSVRMPVAPQAAQRVLLEGSSDLHNWTALDQFNVFSLEQTFLFDRTPPASHRFYRLRVILP